MLLELTHHTVFNYSEPVRMTYLEFRLTPLTDASQHLLQHRQRVSPQRPVRQYVDALGNTVSYLNLPGAAEQIEVVFDSIVETYPTRFRGSGLPLRERSAAAEVMLHDYLQPTSLTLWSGELLEFARPLEALRGAPPAEAAEAIRQTIYSGFRYRRAVTTASSPVEDMLRQRAGVCQDFAHLMIASCRYLGFAARYISGYVLPEEPDGEPLASHAWCEIFDPENGWFGVDPTHNMVVEERYVRLGVGRDYRDVPPNRGLYVGTAKEDLRVQVEIVPISLRKLDARARALMPSRGTPVSSAPKPAPLSLTQQALAVQQQQQRQQQQGGS
jgi:transglutaminase-like putative cysteine protease